MHKSEGMQRDWRCFPWQSTLHDHVLQHPSLLSLQCGARFGTSCLPQSGTFIARRLFRGADVAMCPNTELESVQLLGAKWNECSLITSAVQHGPIQSPRLQWQCGLRSIHSLSLCRPKCTVSLAMPLCLCTVSAKVCRRFLHHVVVQKARSQ